MPNKWRLQISLTKAENKAIKDEVKRLKTSIHNYCKKRLLYGLNYEDPIIPQGLKQEIVSTEVVGIQNYVHVVMPPMEPVKEADPGLVAEVVSANKRAAQSAEDMQTFRKAVDAAEATANPHIHEDDGEFVGRVWVTRKA